MGGSWSRDGGVVQVVGPGAGTAGREARGADDKAAVTDGCRGETGSPPRGGSGSWSGTDGYMRLQEWMG